jgi:hypothetical protein
MRIHYTFLYVRATLGILLEKRCEEGVVNGDKIAFSRGSSESHRRALLVYNGWIKLFELPKKIYVTNFEKKIFLVQDTVIFKHWGRGVGVLFSKEPGTPLKNRLCIFGRDLQSGPGQLLSMKN